MGLCGELGRGDGGNALVDAMSGGDCNSWSDSSWKSLSVPRVFVPVWVVDVLAMKRPLLSLSGGSMVTLFNY